MRQIDFRALRIFVAVAESDTLTQAARRLGITQSAVSQAIKQLEAHISSELVVRRSKPFKLTVSGKIFKEYAVRTLADTQRVLSDIRMSSNYAVLQLNIGMIGSFEEVASQQIMERIGPFACKLSIQTGVAGALSKALLEHDLDILITSDPMEHHPELTQFPILRDPFVIVAPESCGSAHELTPQYLAQNIPFVRYSRQIRIGMLVDLIARRLNIKPDVRYELDSTYTLLRFVQAGHGWSVVTGLCLIPHLELLRGTIVLPLANGAHARHLSLLSHGGELGTLPERLAKICQDIYRDDVVPKLIKIAPWFDEQAYTIDEPPPIA